MLDSSSPPPRIICEKMFNVYLQTIQRLTLSSYVATAGRNRTVSNSTHVKFAAYSYRQIHIRIHYIKINIKIQIQIHIQIHIHIRLYVLFAVCAIESALANTNMPI